jgi:predicted translin family RNA/ssDNA-binding protein
MEFDTYKTKKDKQLKENLIKQLKKVFKQKQIHMEDLNEMKNKLRDIERGLDELKQLLIDINSDDSTMDIQIVKKRYVEAAKVGPR